MGYQIRSDQISRSVVSDSLRPHELQHARPPCHAYKFPCPPSHLLHTHTHTHTSITLAVLWCYMLLCIRLNILKFLIFKHFSLTKTTTSYDPIQLKEQESVPSGDRVEPKNYLKSNRHTVFKRHLRTNFFCIKAKRILYLMHVFNSIYI